MATVTKDFRIKSGLVVEGTNGTINGSDIITEDAITGGTQTNIAVTYDPQSKTVSFVAENGVADSTTDDLVEGSTNLYYTDQRARNAISAAQGSPVTYNGNIGEIDFTLGPTSGLEIDSSNNGLSLPDAATNVGTFGSTTQIPSITVDDKGRVTAVTTNDVATNLSIAGDTGTDTVDLLNDTLTVNGTNGISAAVTDNTITITSNADVAATADTIALRAGTGELNATAFQTNNGNNLNSAGLVLNGGDITSNEDIVFDSTTATFKGNLDVNNGTIVNLSEPVNGGDAATKQYVDSVAQGLDVKESVRVATTQNIDGINSSAATIGGSGFTSLDGVSLVTGDRVLVKNQSTAAENGIYVVTNEGSYITLSRATDADEPAELNAGTFVFVEEGTTYGDTGWVVSSNNPLTIGTDPMNWTQFSGAGTYTAGYGLTLTGTEFAVDNAEIASQGDLSGAVSDLTAYIDGFLNSVDGTTVQYIDDQDQATLLAANAYTDLGIATGDATATPQYLALNVNDIATQVAATATITGTGSAENVYGFLSTDFRSAKFLVKMAFGTHTQVSEVLVTLDTANNVAITEYALVGTNGNIGDVSAYFESADNNVYLTVTSANAVAVNVMGTLLV